ncbi:hypothetical protein HMPREF0281_02622 [Corynebacterium ammoniagenes DSM 20306]|uniref:Uncharacterized protein n=1 Tax=Corynebacterium ammoniagenes DSM 20306 TaxID=649754 RepID=A0ABP2IHX0_CORAM|nr:hypothetical protein HMPREF0281_02622 [Corynebacterium ammoniagenes DSM 20306]
MDRTPNITDKTPANAKATSKPHNTATRTAPRRRVPVGDATEVSAP